MKKKAFILIIVPLSILILLRIAFFEMPFELALILSGISLAICSVITSQKYSTNEKILAVMSIITGACGLGLTSLVLAQLFLSFVFSVLSLGIFPTSAFMDLWPNYPVMYMISGIAGLLLIIISIKLLITFRKKTKAGK